MAVETHPETEAPLEPSTEEEWEHAFGTAIRKAVDDLFTHRLIAEGIAGMANDERVTTLLSNQKLILVEQIEEVAGRTIDEVLGHIDALKTQPGLPSDSLPNQRDDLNHRVE